MKIINILFLNDLIEQKYLNFFLNVMIEWCLYSFNNKQIVKLIITDQWYIISNLI